MAAPNGERVPVVAALATLVELAAQLTRAEEAESIAAIVARSTKWILPVHHASLVLMDDDGIPWTWPGRGAIEPGHGLALALDRRATVKTGAVLAEEAPLAIPGIASWVIVPLVAEPAGALLGALVLGSRDPELLAGMDGGLCHMLALTIASAVRTALLLARERSANERARHAIRMRDHMVATVVHDLRNPLAGALAIVELAAEEVPRPSAIADDLEAVTSALGEVNTIADEMLDVARAEAGQALVLRRASGDIRAVVIAAAAAMRATRGGIGLVTRIEEGALTASIDRARLRRVLDNLLGNAMKYGRAGGTVTLRCLREHQQAVIEVSDDGIGIPAGDLPRLFERFYRASNVGEIHGTGIGLAGAAATIAAHGGTLTATSTEGVGSTFRIVLPLEPAAAG